MCVGWSSTILKKIKVWYLPQWGVFSFFRKIKVCNHLFGLVPFWRKIGYRIPPSPRSRCPVGCKWMGHGWLNYACKSRGPSGQNQAKLCSKIQLGFMDKCSKEASATHRETTTQCSKRYNMVWFAQTGEQCTSMCRDATEKGCVVSAVSAVWAKWTMVNSAHQWSCVCQTLSVCKVDFTAPKIDHQTNKCFGLHDTEDWPVDLFSKNRHKFGPEIGHSTLKKAIMLDTRFRLIIPEKLIIWNVLNF